ncbi:type 11 methyltransferase [Methanocaldococcus villosus KIN24-T80]|uniref:Type 11 methyltransferase n=1 Tax=Methanocaldococcus villosus KIN24-T80 TaxID=1069083 RepID=N6V2T7_9EURY|nr:class I SAM-dependent methyltransferase [Methanocaldococcus villosus]ENN96553.1 type 11 methyltransferase [Methanocaldococcus villosus KIN24-T80]
MEDVKECIKKYWDIRSESYDNSPGHSGLPEVWRSVLYDIFGDKKLRILDVGTGTGFLAILLAELGYEVVGIDLSERMLEKAKNKANKKGLDIEFMIADAENLPFNDEEFDAVINRHLLWTLPNPHRAINEWSRVVRKGGKVVVIDGRWKEETLEEKIRKAIGQVAIIIYERRNPWKNMDIYEKKGINKKLPFYGGSNPEDVINLFKRANLSNISVRDLKWIREKLNKNVPLLYRIAWKNKSYFLVEGYKI